MTLKKLKAALNDCVINFDHRILITDLLQDYELKYKEVNAVLEEFLKQQEKSGVKYEKRFLVRGEEKDGSKEIYTVVEGETKLKEWLSKLKNAETALYSVEVAGGSNAPAETLKPLSRPQIRIKDMQSRDLGKVGVHKNGTDAKPQTQTEMRRVSAKSETAASSGTKASTSLGSKTVSAKKEATPEAKKTLGKAINTTPADKKEAPDAKKPTPDAKSESKHQEVKKAANKKGINTFFAPAGAAQPTGKKNKTVSASPAGPKKMQDFFKTPTKQPEKTAAKPHVEKTAINTEKANTSVQLFEPEDADDIDMVEEESSDEEAHLEKLKREIISSDHEDAEEAGTKSTASTSKRRRILDSDEDEEAPQQKHEKIEEKVVKQEKEEETISTQSETYLDDDGFVITVKAKKPRAKTPPKPVAKVSPPSTKKSPKKSSKSKASAPAATNSKTKQANIMNFFAKK